MGCEVCKEIFIHIKVPKDLILAFSKAVALLNAGELTHAGSESSVTAFERMSETRLWDDIIENHFKCTVCGNGIWLHAETYHGGGGALEVFKEGVVTLGHDQIHT